jgi:hypothetical protein
VAKTDDIRQAAVNAVARALCDQEEHDIEASWWGWSTDEVAEFTADAALAAVVPRLRAHIADQILKTPYLPHELHYDGGDGVVEAWEAWREGIGDAAHVARGGDHA